MDFGIIAQELQLAGFRIDAQRVKNSGKWESVATLDNKSGRKSGRYIIGENICSWVNNKTQETGSFVLDQEKVISRYELDKKRREYAKAERDKYFINALEAKKKYDEITTSPSYKSEYLERKKCKNFGGKIDKDGNFIMPLRSLEVKQDGSRVSYIRSLQTILPNGTKLLESGCEKKGNMHIVGYGGIDHRNPDKFNGDILIAEGYATAVSIHMATGKATVVAVDAGNLDPVLAKLTKAYPNAKFTICADNDFKTEQKTGRNVGVEAALACQRKYGCTVAIPKLSQAMIDEGLTDFNDIHNRLGIEAVKEQFASILILNNEKPEVREPNNRISEIISSFKDEKISTFKNVGSYHNSGEIHILKANPEVMYYSSSEFIHGSVFKDYCEITIGNEIAYKDDNGKEYFNDKLLETVVNEIYHAKELEAKTANASTARFTLKDSLAKISVGTNEDVLNHFSRYDKEDHIAKWREAGLVETQDQFHYLDVENPIRLTSILNREFKTDVKVELAENLQNLDIESNKNIDVELTL